MACFVVPAAEAVVTTIVEKRLAAKECKEVGTEVSAKEAHTIPFSRKVKWLNHMLWGGSALLAFEHVWHGEIVPYFPFLSAAGNPEDLARMLTEMSTTGVTMAALVTLVWGGMVAVSNRLEKKEVMTATKTQ